MPIKQCTNIFHYIYFQLFKIGLNELKIQKTLYYIGIYQA
jgi:hypothetical protein